MPYRMKEPMLDFTETIIQENQGPRAADDDEEDLVDVLLRIQKEGDLEFPLTIDSIKLVISDLFIGGSETSATMLQRAMSELMKKPEGDAKGAGGAPPSTPGARYIELQGQDRVTEESLKSLSYFHMVIKETLRLHPADPLLLPRECRKPCQILGFDVPVGATVFVNAWRLGPSAGIRCIGTNPMSSCQRGLRGKPSTSRGWFEFTPFGAGRRMCPGMTFGLLSMELPLASLLYHFDWVLPQGMEPADLDIDRGPDSHLKAQIRHTACASGSCADVSTSMSGIHIYCLQHM